MAFYYTPPSLPRTPSSCTNMNSSLPSELLSTWSSWRQPKQDALLTPPMSAIPHSRRMSEVHPMTLPPITSFVTPMTPPSSQDWRESSSRLPPLDDTFLHTRQTDTKMDIELTDDDDYTQSQPVDAPPHFVDWLDNTLRRPVGFVAEKTCEMICYLWFATSLPSPTGNRPHNHSPTYTPKHNPSTTALQLVASPNFVTFMQKVLETTQVGQSVIVLSLHYIYRLKERNCLSTAQSGSEFRIAVAALMMANKFLDDNTYTNKTWSEVSGIGLEEVNRMEREFLLGVDFNLYVDQDTYESWRDLLKGLVMAKERDRRMWQRPTRSQHRSYTRPSVHTSSAAPASRSYSSRYRASSHRARSTSPVESRSFTYAFEFTAPSHTATSNHLAVPSAPEYSPTPRPGSKRQAADAFSPTSQTITDIRPMKRPSSMSLMIPDYAQTRTSSGNSTSISPLESLQSFSKMSLASSSPHVPYTPQTRNSSPAWNSSTRFTGSQTLVAAYRAGVPMDMPQNLYYYSLAGSAIEDEESNRRKAKLRRHQPPPPTYTSFYPPQRVMPMNIQSASTSPHDLHPAALPHFHDTVWTRPAIPAEYTTSHDHTHSMYEARQPPHYTPVSDSPIPTAPFANAGPPGFQFYTPPAQQQPSPLDSYNWTRGRRL